MSYQPIFNLPPDTFTTDQLRNELKLLQDQNPELKAPRDATAEDPGMKYEFRVKESLAKHISLQDPDVDQKLWDKWSNTEERPYRKPLPVDGKAAEIAAAIRSDPVTMIVGGTGCGKSTKVPQIILRDSIERREGSKCHIICTQPRRIAARSIAERVASDLGEKLGDTVGFSIRGESVLCREGGGTIKYCTSGVLVRKLIENPALFGVSHVVVDEIHERSLELEVLIYFLQKLTNLRPDFRLVVMSATLNVELYKPYFRYCPVIRIPNLGYPVDTYYLDDMRQIIGSDVSSTEMNGDTRYFVVTQLVEHITKKEPEGAILIFVAGWRDMSELNERFLNYNDSQTRDDYRLKIRMLHSKIPLEDRKVFEAIKGPGRKVIISTTIAESSITVEDVKYVIDMGKANVQSFYKSEKSTTVKPEYITKASAEQRKGRAGRVGPGTCYRLYKRAEFEQFAEYLHAEKGNQNVGSTILNVLSMGEDVSLFQKLVNKPNPYHLTWELDGLKYYKMVGPNDQLTLLGRRVNQMSADPLISKMLIFGSLFGCNKDVATIAAGHSIARLFPFPQGHKVTRKHRKQNKRHKPPTRAQLTRNITLSNTSDAMAILGAIVHYEKAEDKQKYCNTNLLDLKSVQEILQMTNVIQEELKVLKGMPEREQRPPCLQDIIGGAFCPNLAFCHAHGIENKFYLSWRKEFMRTQPDSVFINDSGAPGIVAFERWSGVKPKYLVNFVNRITRGAAIIFSTECEFQGFETAVINKRYWDPGMIIQGSQTNMEFIKGLRNAFNCVLADYLTAPKDILPDSVHGKVLDLVVRYLNSIR